MTFSNWIPLPPATEGYCQRDEKKKKKHIKKPTTHSSLFSYLAYSTSLIVIH